MRLAAEPLVSVVTTVGPIVVTPLGPTDVLDARQLLEESPEVCFQPWEVSLLEDVCETGSDLVLGARDSTGRLLGVLMAGTYGVRGTISHLAVSPEARGRGVASRLVNSAHNAFRRRGVLRIFVFTTAGNLAGESFWRSQGMTETHGEKTFEVDL